MFRRLKRLFSKPKREPASLVSKELKSIDLELERFCIGVSLQGSHLLAPQTLTALGLLGFFLLALEVVKLLIGLVIILVVIAAATAPMKPRSSS